MSGNVGFVPFISRAARNAAMASAYSEEGLSLSQVGARFGVTKHTVHQILRAVPGMRLREPGFGWKPAGPAEARQVTLLPCGSYSVELTQGYSTVVDACDLDLATKFAWRLVSGAAERRLYASRKTKLDGKISIEFLHRAILRASKSELVDHRDGDTLNNRRSNLRACDATGNACNRGLGRNNTSGFKGVSRVARGYRAQISFRRCRFYIGTYSTPDLAALAYNRKAIELHGEFARLNDIGGQS